MAHSQQVFSSSDSDHEEELPDVRAMVDVEAREAGPTKTKTTKKTKQTPAPKSTPPKKGMAAAAADNPGKTAKSKWDLFIGVRK